MWLVNLISDLLCGALFSLGGYHWIWMRRFILPAVLGGTVGVITHNWYCVLLPLPAMGTLCLGYFSGNNWGRALWVYVQAISLSVGLMIFGHLAWWIYIPYVLGAGILGGFYKNWQQLIGDSIVGCYLASFIFFVR